MRTRAKFQLAVEKAADSRPRSGAAPRAEKTLASFRRRALASASLVRAVAQPGSALAWGARGREFESHRPDHLNRLRVKLGRLCGVRFGRVLTKDRPRVLTCLPIFPEILGTPEGRRRYFKICSSHCIHLNPVRAGVVPVEQLKTYRYSSYWYLWRPASRRAPESKISQVEAGGCRLDENPHPSIQSLVDRELAFGSARGAQS